MKLAALAHVFTSRSDVVHHVVHTGQHFDTAMSADFFRDLSIRKPDVNLEVGSGTHATQTAWAMERLEPVLLERRPDIVLVYGDVNSTVAAALVAAKLRIPIGHVEAGLRSHDRDMPEEINRVVTDRLSDWLFAPSRDAVDNLRAEGEPEEEIHFVGNVMIDSLVRALPAARALDVPGVLGVGGGPYVVATLHRPSNVDDAAILGDLVVGLAEIAATCPVLFPVHPRTRQALGDLDGRHDSGPLRLLEPMSYLQMVGLVSSSALVITDSGGLQEETSYLGVPCLTVRNNTERPVTCTEGTNRLVAAVGSSVRDAAREVLATQHHPSNSIERWDGKAGERVAGVLLDGARFD